MDLEAFKQMLTEANVTFHEPEDFGLYKTTFPNLYTLLEVENTPGFGAGGFLAVYLFDKDGNLIALGHWD